MDNNRVEPIVENSNDIQDFVSLKGVTIVLDTSSVQYAKTFELIECAKCVIIPSVTLIELNRLKDTIKNENISLYHSVQKVLKACALDVKGEKYSILNFARSTNECPDQTIVRNSVNIKDAVCCY